MHKILLLLLANFFIYSARNPVHKIQFNGAAQGSSYNIIYYQVDTLVTQRQVDSILDRIDSSLSLYKEYSLINRFNHSSTGIAVDKHFRTVVNKAIDTYRQTAGLFDITIFPITEAWGFGPKRVDSTPQPQQIRGLLDCVDSRLLYWKGDRLLKRKPCVQLDANGIAQGYSVDVIAGFFERRGISNYLIELGGEIRVRGRKPTGEKMSIGIESPGDDADFAPIDKVIYLDHGAITTSGNYRRFHASNGRKVSHLMDPHTGYPIDNELISVSLFAPDAITADAYDNALMGMGLKKALAFVERRPTWAAHFIYHRKDGTIADTMSTRFSKLIVP